MDQRKLTRGCAIALAAYIALAIAFYLICGEQLHYREVTAQALTARGVVGEVTSDAVVEQRLSPQGDMLTGVTLTGDAYGRQNTGRLTIEVRSGDAVLDSREVDVSAIGGDGRFSVALNAAVPEGGDVALRVTAPDSAPGNAVTLCYGNTVQASRAQVAAVLTPEDRVTFNGEPLDGALCATTVWRQALWFGAYYWHFAAAILVALALYCAHLIRGNRRGQYAVVIRLYSAFERYRFLIKQLVARDFKGKYKRSVLGVLWSFLNPLLTMTVQYIIFSTLFKSDIPNFALYLVIGIVCFSFFNEATSMTLTSIINNASLITKVYVPKYIYPLTRVMSSTVNFLLALVPLFAVMLFSGVPVRVSILLLPLGIICLFMLCLGVGMFLAASMVFFRDTLFLWGVISMLWMYATPIFYPETILPARLLPVFRLNPLYHIIRFFRIVLMNGISPEPLAYGQMLIASLAPLALGVWVFKRSQDKFVFYL